MDEMRGRKAQKRVESGLACDIYRLSHPAVQISISIASFIMVRSYYERNCTACSVQSCAPRLSI